MPEGAKILSDVTYQVHADRKWQKTGIKVTKLEKAVITYRDGSWNISPAVRGCGANGTGVYIAKPGYTMPGKPEGGLIGRIGSDVFWIGSRGETPAGLQGELELCVNDDLDGRYGAGFQDNSGSITVEIALWLS